jgi:SAM-dependent methyltransferase
MSSPIAKSERTHVDRALVAVHQKMSHGHRIGVLAEELASRLQVQPRAGAALRLLDIGCGDMTLADALQSRLPDLEVACTDIHPCPQALQDSDARWRRYTRFDGRRLPYDNERFDVAMFSDVLHHVPLDSQALLLSEAARVANVVLVKDHFEWGAFSRQALRAMDFVGNFGYGVPVPDRYFTKETFGLLCDAASLTIQEVDIGIRLYDHLPLVRSVLSPDWQFIATCTRQAPHRQQNRA